jgi:hypothetical protein
MIIQPISGGGPKKYERYNTTGPKPNNFARSPMADSVKMSVFDDNRSRVSKALSKFQKK